MNISDDEDQSVCTRDDAVSIIIGLGRIHPQPLKRDATQYESKHYENVCFTYREYLRERSENLERDYEEAKYNKSHPTFIAEALTALNEIKLQICDEKVVSAYVDDEIAKLNMQKPSALRFDKQSITNLKEQRYTYFSVKECEKKIRDKIRNNKSSVKVPKFSAQEKAILKELRQRELDPLNLPRDNSGHSGVKAEIKILLVGTELFQTEKTFDRVWEKMSKNKTLIKLKLVQPPTPNII